MVKNFQEDVSHFWPLFYIMIENVPCFEKPICNLLHSLESTWRKEKRDGNLPFQTFEVDDSAESNHILIVVRSELFVREISSKKSRSSSGEEKESTEKE